MNTNKITVFFTIIVIILIVGIPTTYKVIKNYQNNLTKSVEAKIIESAKKCYYDEKCDEDKILLKKLYELEYLEPISNPITKEYYNEDSYIEITDEKFIFYEKK